MRKTIPVYESSGNVFADLGLPDAEEAKAKAGLAQRIIMDPEFRTGK